MISYTSPVSYNRHACSLVQVHHVHCIAIYNRHRIPLSLALKQRLKKILVTLWPQTYAFWAWL